MKWIFWIALKLRLSNRFWGEWYIKWHRQQIKKAISKIDLDTSDIKFIPQNPADTKGAK